MERRLAAIMAADVVGYSRLMETDEAGTLDTLKARRRAVLEPLVAKHRARIFKTTGDGVLVEFASAVNAVQCAVDLQQGMAAANAKESEDRHIVLRIGINLGDVMVEGSDLYGDGVNIAARLESMADPGGILVSGTAYDHIKSKVKVGFEDLGPQNLKNIAEPVRAYRVTGTPAVAHTSSKPGADKPSIAVLPFTNLSGDPEQQYFSDGITEDIITELSRFRELFVIARNSSFQFRDKMVDVKQIGHDLGVGYVVEGSVRKAANRIRVTAQLVETATGNHLWADRFDRDVADVFAVQDEVTRTIVATLVGRLVASGAHQGRRKATQHWSAYDYFLQGRELQQQFDVESAEPLLRRAIEMDPGFAQAHAWLAAVLLTRFFLSGRLEPLNEAFVYAEKAVSLDDSDAWCHWAVGMVYTFRNRLDIAGVHLGKAVALNPTDVQIACIHAMWLGRIGRTTEALKNLDDAVRRDPFIPDWFWEARQVPLLQEKRYEEVIQAVNRMNRPQAWNHAYAAAAYAHLGLMIDARREAAEVLRLKPDYSIEWMTVQEPYENPAHLQNLLDGLREAGLGLPE
jgi:adenylate cyclase